MWWFISIIYLLPPALCCTTFLYTGLTATITPTVSSIGTALVTFYSVPTCDPSYRPISTENSAGTYFTNLYTACTTDMLFQSVIDGTSCVFLVPDILTFSLVTSECSLFESVIVPCMNPTPPPLNIDTVTSTDIYTTTFTTPLTTLELSSTSTVTTTNTQTSTLDTTISTTSLEVISLSTTFTTTQIIITTKTSTIVVTQSDSILKTNTLIVTTFTQTVTLTSSDLFTSTTTNTNTLTNTTTTTLTTTSCPETRVLVSTISTTTTLFVTSLVIVSETKKVTVTGRECTARCDWWDEDY